jgi:hypothetical protein
MIGYLFKNYFKVDLKEKYMFLILTTERITIGNETFETKEFEKKEYIERFDRILEETHLSFFELCRLFCDDEMTRKETRQFIETYREDAKIPECFSYKLKENIQINIEREMFIYKENTNIIIYGIQAGTIVELDRHRKITSDHINGLLNFGNEFLNRCDFDSFWVPDDYI